MKGYGKLQWAVASQWAAGGTIPVGPFRCLGSSDLLGVLFVFPVSGIN